MPEVNAKRESSSKHASAWVESSFTSESPSAPKKRRVDDLVQGTSSAKSKPKPPVWVASEFRAQPSPSKPHVRLPPPRPKDPVPVRAVTRPTSEFIDPRAPLDPKPKKHPVAKPLSVQPIPAPLPKTIRGESAHRPQDLTLSRIQTPIFQANNLPPAVPNEALRDVAPMPPPPRIEPKIPAVPAPVVVVGDYVPLTDLTMPRFFECNNSTGKGKGRMPKSDDDFPISDEPSMEATRVAEDAESFGMKELSLEIDPNTSNVGHPGNAGRKGSSKFIKGGLAARALMVITQRDKDDALWHHYQTAKLSKNLNIREDLRVHVVEVLQSVGESVLVRCSTQPVSILGDGVPDTHSNLVDVLLSQPGKKSLPAVEPSAVIRIWKPWTEINLDVTSRPLPAPFEGKLDDKHPNFAGDVADDTKEQSPQRPEDSRAYGENLAPDRRPRSALLCSRFVVAGPESQGLYS